MNASSSRPLDEIQTIVRERYAASALNVIEQRTHASCCGDGSDSGCCGSAEFNPLAVADYDPHALADLPQDAVLASLGCGNPTALANLTPGETVLDLGSGGGIDVLLSAKRVGPAGFVYGLDMTDEMLALAERNRTEAGIENVRFIKGTIEAIPLPDASFDTIISNCVINLSGDKAQVMREAFRVLKPGGRFAVSDIVVQGELLPEVRESMSAWSACVAGALTIEEYRDQLEQAGFRDVGVEITNVHRLSDLSADDCCGVNVADLEHLQGERGTLASAFIRATRPRD